LYTVGQKLIRRVGNKDHPVLFVMPKLSPEGLEMALVVGENDMPLTIAMSELRPAETTN